MMENILAYDCVVHTTYDMDIVRWRLPGGLSSGCRWRRDEVVGDVSILTFWRVFLVSVDARSVTWVKDL
jgi:hypothetical protein